MDEILKKRVGRTPLIRARKLEKELGIKKIFLKLEGNNPSGHSEDRLAYLIIRDALARGKKTICMGTYGTIGGSLSYLSRYYDINLVFYVPDEDKISRKDLLDSDKVEIRENGGTYEECVTESRRVAQKNNWYDANFGYANSVMNMYAFSYIAKEINNQLNGEVNTIFCQTFNGSSIAGIHLGLKDLWIDETIEKLPKIWAVSTENGNAIIESYEKGSKEILTLDENDTVKTEHSRHMVNTNCYNGQDALNAIHDTYGGAVGVQDEELTKNDKKVKDLENIDMSTANSFAITGFIKAAKEGEISDGNHVIILPDGTIELDVRVLSKSDLNISYEEMLERLDEWLLEFSDPMCEMREAVENAFEDGYVLGAFDHNTLVGLSIVSRSGFDTFFPKYHLSYIATKKDVKGRGIATRLIQEALQAANGDLSLHVETNNKKAIKLYEKMGLRKKYYRMIYEGEEHGSKEENSDEG
ncbi:MAG: pyridoxal-phosphate dependent enzyme [Candidatus Thermoplasmatota archaeon]